MSGEVPLKSYRRLRPGPGLSREVVETHQRSRLQRATIELVATDGYEALTVRGLTKRARISSGTFYSRYRSTDDCLLSAFDLICQCLSQRLVEVGQNESEPRRRLELALECLFQEVAASPEVATFMLRAAPAVGPAFTSGLRNSTMRLGVALEFCMSSDNSPPLHPLLLEGMVAGLAWFGRAMVSGTTGEDQIRGVAAEAAEWISSLDAPLAEDAELSSQQGNGLPATGRLRNGDWDGALGDERTMILAAAFRIARCGYHQLSVRRICREAGVSRRDFNRHFSSIEDCFISALEERASGAIATLARGGLPSATWSCAIYEALRTLCRAVEDDRDSARVLFVEITAAGTEGVDCRDRLISLAARTLRATIPEERSPSGLAAEASTASAWAILSGRVQDQSSAPTAVLPILTRLMLTTPPKVKKQTAADKKQTSRNKKHTVEVKNPFPYRLTSLE